MPILSPMSNKRSSTITTEGNPVDTFSSDVSLLRFSEKGSGLEGITSWASDCPTSSDLFINTSEGLSLTQQVGDTNGSCIVSDTAAPISLALSPRENEGTLSNSNISSENRSPSPRENAGTSSSSTSLGLTKKNGETFGNSTIRKSNPEIPNVSSHFPSLPSSGASQTSETHRVSTRTGASSPLAFPVVTRIHLVVKCLLNRCSPSGVVWQWFCTCKPTTQSGQKPLSGTPIKSGSECQPNGLSASSGASTDTVWC